MESLSNMFPRDAAHPVPRLYRRRNAICASTIPLAWSTVSTIASVAPTRRSSLAMDGPDLDSPRPPAFSPTLSNFSDSCSSSSSSSSDSEDDHPSHSPVTQHSPQPQPAASGLVNDTIEMEGGGHRRWKRRNAICNSLVPVPSPKRNRLPSSTDTSPFMLGAEGGHFASAAAGPAGGHGGFVLGGSEGHSESVPVCQASADASVASEASHLIHSVQINDETVSWASFISHQFDHNEYTIAELKRMIVMVFEQLGFLERYVISRVAMSNFVDAVCEGYADSSVRLSSLPHGPNPYHNFRHAFDVFQMLVHLLVKCDAQSLFSPLNVFALLLAALCHDIDHPGTNNGFQVAALTEVALTFNDASVLENHHARLTFSLLRKPESNVLRNLSAEQFRQVRATMIQCILATDMSKHDQVVSTFRQLVTAHQVVPNTDEATQRNIAQFLLHVCDISNVARPFVLSQRWNRVLIDEFFAQGDAELRMGLPVTPFMDRRAFRSEADSAIGFLKFVGQPTFAVLADGMSSASHLLTQVRDNIDSWQAQQSPQAPEQKASN